MVVTTDEPAISLELWVAIVGVSAKFTGGVTLVTWVMGGGDHNSSTAGICTGDLVNGLHSFAASVDTQGDVFRIWDNSDIVDVGLSKPLTESLTALLFLHCSS